MKDAYILAQELCETSHCHARGVNCVAYAEEVGELLLAQKPDAHTLIACFLQCAREPEMLRRVEERFGHDIAATIATHTMLDIGHSGYGGHPTGMLRRIVLALSAGNIRVLFIALHTRLNTLRHAERLLPKDQIATARETLDIFAPLCARLGIYALKYELETLAFRILYPEEARTMEEMMKAIRKQYGPFLTESKRTLGALLSAEGKQTMILTREKHSYSIFRKLQKKSLTSAHDLHDLFGMRLLVETEEECYQVLGIIHRMYRPISHRLKDYIAMPKPNGYRSIHTTVLGLSKENAALPVEIQIRTHAMDEEAEFGIAAHWNYKESGGRQPLIGSTWQAQLATMLHSAEGDEQIDEDISEVLTDRIFAMTPKGDVIELPKGSGPLDFAFRVHTDVGLRYRYAKVNGTIAAIDHPLENGDMVQITMWSEPKPSPQWIQIVQTTEARQKLRGFLRRDGEILQKEVLPLVRASVSKPQRKEKVTPIASLRPKVHLESQVPLPYCFARCCEPDEHSLQRPPIVGYITRNGAVRIHWSGCRMIMHANQDRLIRASWIIPDEVPLRASPLFSGT